MRLGAAAPRSLRSAPEQNTVTRSREHDGPHVRVARRVTQRPVQLLEQARGEGVAVVRRVQRQRADAVAVLHADQRIRHGWAV